MSSAARKLFLLHLVINALLLWVAYEWLGVGESTRTAAALERTLRARDSGAGLLVSRRHAGLFPQGEVEIKDAFAASLRQVPALLAAAVLVLALYGLVAWAAAASGQPAFRLASWLTLKFRTPVKPVTVARIFLGGFWIVRWVLLPVALLPMASGIAAHGWRGVRRNWLARRMALLAGGAAAAGSGIAAAVRRARLGARGERLCAGGGQLRGAYAGGLSALCRRDVDTGTADCN